MLWNKFQIDLKPPVTVAKMLDLCSEKFLGLSYMAATEDKRLILLRTGKGPRIENDQDLMGRKLVYFLSYEVVSE